MSVPALARSSPVPWSPPIETGNAFAKGRDFAAWSGLVPKQTSTGDPGAPTVQWSATEKFKRQHLTGTFRHLPDQQKLTRFGGIADIGGKARECRS
jgi:hypothetical protein